MKNNPKFILSGGGTGGHIYPAIAIANELKLQFPESEILFVGAKDKMEMKKVPQAGYTIKGLWIAGIQRKITFQNMLFPLKLASSLLKSFFILKKFKPDIVIGTGGFASGAVLKMATLMQIPILIQEQNSYPGITNKLLSKKANAICVAYENLEKFFPSNKTFLTGNPVRQDLLSMDSRGTEGFNYFNLDSTKKTLLVLGGSLGARRINQLIEKELEYIVSQNLQIIWQCGQLYYPTYQHLGQKNVVVLDFIDKMDIAYATADFILSRSGASSVSELAIVGKPVLFIPSPNVAEDHQTKNAQAIVSKKGAILIKEKDLDTQFETLFSELLSNENEQKELALNIKKLAMPDATKNIVSRIIKLINNES